MVDMCISLTLQTQEYDWTSLVMTCLFIKKKVDVLLLIISQNDFLCWLIFDFKIKSIYPSYDFKEHQLAKTVTYYLGVAQELFRQKINLFDFELILVVKMEYNHMIIIKFHSRFGVVSSQLRQKWYLQCLNIKFFYS